MILMIIAWTILLRNSSLFLTNQVCPNSLHIWDLNNDPWIILKLVSPLWFLWNLTFTYTSWVYMSLPAQFPLGEFASWFVKQHFSFNPTFLLSLVLTVLSHLYIQGNIYMFFSATAKIDNSYNCEDTSHVKKCTHRDMNSLYTLWFVLL